MEVVLAVAIGVLTASGVWLVLRPRAFQLVIGLSLLAYAVNLFVFSIGGLAIDKEPILVDGSRAAAAPVFQAALKLTENPQGRAEM